MRTFVRVLLIFALLAPYNVYGADPIENLIDKKIEQSPIAMESPIVPVGAIFKLMLKTVKKAGNLVDELPYDEIAKILKVSLKEAKELSHSKAVGSALIQDARNLKIKGLEKVDKLGEKAIELTDKLAGDVDDIIKTVRNAKNFCLLVQDGYNYKANKILDNLKEGETITLDELTIKVRKEIIAKESQEVEYNSETKQLITNIYNSENKMVETIITNDDGSQEIIKLNPKTGKKEQILKYDSKGNPIRNNTKKNFIKDDEIPEVKQKYEIIVKNPTAGSRKILIEGTKSFIEEFLKRPITEEIVNVKNLTTGEILPKLIPEKKVVVPIKPKETGKWTRERIQNLIDNARKEILKGNRVELPRWYPKNITIQQKAELKVLKRLNSKTSLTVKEIGEKLDIIEQNIEQEIVVNLNNWIAKKPPNMTPKQETRFDDSVVKNIKLRNKLDKRKKTPSKTKNQN